MVNEQQKPPWDTGPTDGRMYPDDETRGIIRDQVMETLQRHAGGLGIVASKLAPEVAEELYDPETGNVVASRGDVTLEISRMLGSKIRMAPNRRLFPKR